VIFDFDGVILESADIKTAGLVEAFSDYPQHGEAVREYDRAHMGLSRHAKVEGIYREILGIPLAEAERTRRAQAFAHLTLDRVLSCPFVPGALELLRSLDSRCLAFVASGTPHDELEVVVNRREIRGYFEEVWGSPATKVEIVGDILARHRLGRGEILFVGDSITDYEAASQAGVPFVARKTPHFAERWRDLKVAAICDLWGLFPMLGLPPADR
jgi:HAD superfamily hydrolase (TIGR01549 family)